MMRYNPGDIRKNDETGRFEIFIGDWAISEYDNGWQELIDEHRNYDDDGNLIEIVVEGVSFKPEVK